MKTPLQREARRGATPLMGGEPLVAPATLNAVSTGVAAAVVGPQHDRAATVAAYLLDAFALHLMIKGDILFRVDIITAEIVIVIHSHS